ncbi:helix-turn-helix domain-containing protein [Acidaminococcus sp.]|uniref:helix-turn-helix domain-containing protein n=1 Tax=Acidaminococcus sp. TaxID=1872103 RepID=UPI003D7E4627
MMTTIREARLRAGLTQQAMSDRFEIGLRTIKDWEAGTHHPPKWAERLVIRELEQIAIIRLAAEERQKASGNK